MSQFIESTNQDVLWNTFQKIPNVFNLPKQLQEEMFRSGISHIYLQQNPHGKLRNDQLRQLNKEMITYLIGQVRMNESVSGETRMPQKQQQHQLQSQPQPQQPFYETTEEKTQRIFTEKQKIYEQMTSKPDLPKPSELFQEPKQDDDGVILNMDELIVQYQEQRNQEVPAYDPIPQSLMNVVDNEKDNFKKILDMLEKLETRIEAIETHFIGLGNLNLANENYKNNQDN